MATATKTKRVPLNQDASWEKAIKTSGALYSANHCCQCGRSIPYPEHLLLCCRTDDGDWWVCEPGPVQTDETNYQRFYQPIGGECLKKNPEYRIGLFVRA